MVITYHNETCFKISSGKVCVVVDPVSEKFKADLTLYTQSNLLESENNSESNRKSNLRLTSKRADGSIYGGGEYEIHGILVHGIQVNYDAKNFVADIIYSVTLENIKICFMGNITSLPSAEILEKVGEVDILFIPTGKGHLDSKSAAKLVKQIEPSISVPYPPGQIKSFLDDIGKKCENLDKLAIRKKEIIDIGDKTKIICIKS